jgi:hypothetical protein
MYLTVCFLTVILKNIDKMVIIVADSSVWKVNGRKYRENRFSFREKRSF